MNIFLKVGVVFSAFEYCYNVSAVEIVWYNNESLQLLFISDNRTKVVYHSLIEALKINLLVSTKSSLHLKLNNLMQMW